MVLPSWTPWRPWDIIGRAQVHGWESGFSSRLLRGEGRSPSRFTCTPLGDLRQDRWLLWLASSLCKWGGGTYSSGLLDDWIYITVKEQCWVLIKCMYPHIHMCIHAVHVCICVYMSYSVWTLYASICICIHVIPCTCYICACIYTYHTTHIHYVCVYTYILNKKQF